MSLMKMVYSQFSKPRGLLGYLAGQIMGHRKSNIKRNLWTINNLDIQEDDCVLEIGYGPGIAISSCAEKLKDGFFVGVDHSEKMLEMASHHNQQYIDNKIVDLRVGNIEDRPISKEKFSKIYSTNVAQFWSDKNSTFSYLNELLLDGGVLATTYQPRHRGATDADSLQLAREIKNIMEELRFKEVTVSQLELRPLVVCIRGIK